MDGEAALSPVESSRAQRADSYGEANCRNAAHSTKLAEKQRSEPVSVLRQAIPKRCNPAYSLSALVLH